MKDYSEEKYYRMIRHKQLIYTNQLKRLSKDGKRANSVLIYYSIALIVYTLTLKYFDNLLNPDVTEYTSIVLSIIILIYSIINSNSRYSDRVKNVEDALKEVKVLKRKLGDIVRNTEPNSKERREEFKKLKVEYENIVSPVEYRDDLDFYYSVRYLCKKFGVDIRTGDDVDPKCDLSSLKLTESEIKAYKDEIRGYLIELTLSPQRLHMILRYLWHCVLYILPVAVFVVCMVL